MLHEDKCNVCGAAFKSIWGPMWWGTFWSARCDYVKNLVPPSELAAMNNLAQVGECGLRLTQLDHPLCPGDPRCELLLNDDVFLGEDRREVGYSRVDLPDLP